MHIYADISAINYLHIHQIFPLSRHVVAVFDLANYATPWQRNLVFAPNHALPLAALGACAHEFPEILSDLDVIFPARLKMTSSRCLNALCSPSVSA